MSTLGWVAASLILGMSGKFLGDPRKSLLGSEAEKPGRMSLAYQGSKPHPSEGSGNRGWWLACAPGPVPGCLPESRVEQGLRSKRTGLSGMRRCRSRSALGSTIKLSPRNQRAILAGSYKAAYPALTILNYFYI